MKLSDAIALGQGTVGKWESGQIQHCALGMACNSIGRAEWLKESGDYGAIREQWPWLKETIEYPFRERMDGSRIFSEAIEVVYDTFDTEVMGGEVSFEKFLDWIRSIEQQEQETANAEAPVAPSLQHTEAR